MKKKLFTIILAFVTLNEFLSSVFYNQPIS